MIFGGRGGQEAGNGLMCLESGGYAERGQKDKTNRKKGNNEERKSEKDKRKHTKFKE
jgi:hypothetical protein